MRVSKNLYLRFNQIVTAKASRRELDECPPFWWTFLGAKHDVIVHKIHSRLYAH